MGATIEDYIDAMDDILDNAKSVPLSPNKFIVDIAILRQYLDDIRASIPQEIKQASTIVMDRNSIIEDAKRKADDIISRAEARANALVAENEITKAAEQRAAELEKTAVAKSKAVKSGTDDYITNLLASTENVLTANLNQIRKMKAAVKGSGSNGANRQ